MLIVRRAASIGALSLILAIVTAIGAGAAAGAVTTPGLAPQFRSWPVPIYASHVAKTTTWAANSYEILSSDSVDHAIAWYRAKLKDRATLIHGRITQLAVDGGSYVINFETFGSGGASINVIKN